MQDYVAWFHRARPGITEAVLRRSRDSGVTPYEWLLSAVPDKGLVLDLACGSAPMWPALAGRPYLGVDSSAEELALAQRGGAFPLVRASAAQLPVATVAVTAVVASMALMVVQPLTDALAEVHRVLATGGRLVATVPARGPLRGRDMPVLAGLLVALGRVPAYPNDRLTPRLPALLRAAGFRVVSDSSRRFSYPMRSAGDADTLLDSLYLPGLPRTRQRCARAYLHAVASARRELPVPIRRIVARAGSSPSV